MRASGIEVQSVMVIFFFLLLVSINITRDFRISHQTCSWMIDNKGSLTGAADFSSRSDAQSEPPPPSSLSLTHTHLDLHFHLSTIPIKQWRTPRQYL